MKLETLQNPIKTESIEQHERELRDKMTEVQLEYVERLFSGEIRPLSEKVKIDNFENLLNNYTEISSKIMEFRDGALNENELIELNRNLLSEIESLYNNDHEHWIEKSKELFDASLEKYKALEKNTNNDDGKNSAGLISFGMEINRGESFPSSSISNSDICMEIHFEDFFKQKSGDEKKSFSLDYLNDSLKKLALKIVDEHPETKAVTGHSWLMSTPIAERIGFVIYEKNSSSDRAGGNFWGQFMDSNGQLKTKEILKFLETGEPTYRVATGAIMVEDFLRRYLPENRKGKIILKDQTQESREFIKDLNRISSRMNMWDTLSIEDILVLINSNKILSDYFKTTEGEKYLNVLKKAKELGLKAEEMKYFNYENMEEIKNNFVKFVEESKNKFVDREVII